jgi:hypothetical protein
VVAIVFLYALPQSLDRNRCSFKALDKNFFGVQQMSGDTQRAVALAALHQQIEQMQTAQLVCGLRPVNKTFQHDGADFEHFG